MSESSKLGMNRTGIQTSPIQSAEMAAAAQKSTPTSAGTEQLVADVRISYAKDKDAEPVGNVPPPGTLKGMAKTALKAMQGQKPTVLVDKLGERAAFERTGTRLYEGLLSKFDAYGSWEGGPTRGDLEQFHREELEHFGLVVKAIQQMGADPTVMTPSADVHAVASEGVMKVITDARTDLRQSLEAILIAELADNECWDNLIKLARASGQDSMAEGFERAYMEEQRHLHHVRAWISAGIGKDAHVPMDQSPTP